MKDMLGESGSHKRSKRVRSGQLVERTSSHGRDRRTREERKESSEGHSQDWVVRTSERNSQGEDLETSEERLTG